MSEKSRTKCLSANCQNPVRPTQFHSAKYCEFCSNSRPESAAHQQARERSLKLQNVTNQLYNMPESTTVNNQYFKHQLNQESQINRQKSGIELPINFQNETYKRPGANTRYEISAYDMPMQKRSIYEFQPTIYTHNKDWDDNNLNRNKIYDHSGMVVKVCNLCANRFESSSEYTRICKSCQVKNPKIYY